jgi:hypothetical protein
MYCQQLSACQPWDDPYIPRTYPHLLKWKFRHMNSVDFKLAAMPGQQPRLLLNCAMRRKHGSTDINHLSLQGERVCTVCTVLFRNSGVHSAGVLTPAADNRQSKHVSCQVVPFPTFMLS